MVKPIHPTPPSSPGPLSPPARVLGPLTRISIDPENMDETLRQPIYQELTPFTGRRLGDFELVAFEEVLNRWSTAIKEVVTAQRRRRPPNPMSQWARRRRRREQDARSPSPAAELPADPSQTTEEQGQTSMNNRASGRARQATWARFLQKLYRANSGACMRCLLEDGPPVYCKNAESDLVEHFTAAYAESPPFGPPPTWLFPIDVQMTLGAGVSAEGDVLQEPFTPEEVVTQFRRAKRSAPGVESLTYANWRWVDPQGLILATI